MFAPRSLCTALSAVHLLGVRALWSTFYACHQLVYLFQRRLLRFDSAHFSFLPLPLSPLCCSCDFSLFSSVSHRFSLAARGVFALCFVSLYDPALPRSLVSRAPVESTTYRCTACARDAPKFSSFRSFFSPKLSLLLLSSGRCARVLHKEHRSCQ